MIESLSPVVKVLEKEYSDEFVNGLLLTSYLPKERKSSLERLLIRPGGFACGSSCSTLFLRSVQSPAVRGAPTTVHATRGDPEASVLADRDPHPARFGRLGILVL